MSFDFDQIVENHFKEKRDIFGFKGIAELIEEVLEARKGLSTLVENMMPPAATFEWSMIPDIPISEIGWSDVSTTTEGKTILGPQRALLQQYLDNIGKKGGTFEEQIKSLESFYGEEGPAQIIAGAEGNNIEIIRKLISYLVFYKTLTKIVTNFNASSAGFTFEAFLASLMKGTQVKANTGTIADFYTGAGIPVSLKLYTKLKVGGSWADLIGDIINPRYEHPDAEGHAMRYVACIKRFGGEDEEEEVSDLKQRGEIAFYQFDITINNIMDIMLASIHPRVCWLPSRLVTAADDVAGSMPARDKLPSNEELEIKFIENLEEIYPRLVPPELIQAIDPEFPARGVFIERALKALKYPREKHKDLFNKWNGLAYTRMEPYNKLRDEILWPLFQSLYSNNPNFPASKTAQRPIQDYLKLLANAFKEAHNSIVAGFEASEIARARKEILADVTWVSDPETLKIYYDDLNIEQKKQALLNTYGILQDDQRQFDLNEVQATNSGAPTFSKDLGSLKVGGAYVEEMLQRVSGALNAEIFAVFTSLKDLSDSLNRYFAGGLEMDDEAQNAIDNARDIEERTKETRVVATKAAEE
jgi:hypothetical protein